MCLNMEKLEDKIEFMAKHRAPEAHWAIRRWSSNFFLHLGALVEGYSAWADDLDQYAQLLGDIEINPRQPPHY